MKDQKRFASKLSAIVIALVALMLVVSGAPLSHADPNQPGDGPTITPIEPPDEADPPVLDSGRLPEAEDWPVADAPVSKKPGTLSITWPNAEIGDLTPSQTGYIEPPFDADEVNDAAYSSGLDRATLPAKYDLRDTIPQFTAARSQGNWGTCWAFASTSSAVSTLVRSGALAGSDQLSPLNLVQAVYNTGTFKANTTTPPMNMDSSYQIGGNYYQSAAAWSHWFGPRMETAHQYPPLANQGTLPTPWSVAQLKSSDYHFRSMYLLPAPRDSKRVYKAANVTAIKQAVFSYGAAYTGISTWNLDSPAYFNETEKSFYDNQYSPRDHAVTVIGWDDNFAKTKFMKTPPGNGAFLIMNSWGAGIANRDFFWMSYYDTTMAESAILVLGNKVSTTDHRSAWEWSSQYAYDELGIRNSVSYNTKSVTYANRYPVTADSTLRAVQIGTRQPNMSYKVQVYTGAIKSNSATAGGTAKVVTSGGAKATSGKFKYAGYNTVTLSRPVVLKAGQYVSIVVTLTAPTGQAARASIEQSFNFGAGYDTLTLATGQSFIKSGSKWLDMYTVYKGWGALGTYGNFNIIGLASATPELKVNYMPNGGTVGAPSKSVLFGTKVGTLETPIRTGYTFTGWYTKASGGTKYTSAKVYTTVTDTNIYAHWKAKKYTVKFNADGGTTPKTNNKVTKSKSVTFGKTYGPLPTTKRTGYTYGGWYTEQSGGTKITSGTKMDTAAGHTLYARWTPKTYTVKFDPRSGTADFASKSVTYNDSYGALPGANRPGYDFQGWFTKTSGGTQITDTSKVKITATQTLYARWTPTGP